MKAVGCAIACALILSACATTASPERIKLTRDELSTMRPQIAEHLTCMARNASVYASGTTDLGILLDTAAYTCKSKLVALSDRLQHFNLSEKAQLSYVRAVEMASRNIITDRIIKARTQASGKRSTPAGG